MAELGRVPDVGDRTEHGGLELTVARREGLRVTELIVRRKDVVS
jgi:CBS domain containing-hemolysin-like protein